MTKNELIKALTLLIEFPHVASPFPHWSLPTNDGANYKQRKNVKYNI